MQQALIDTNTAITAAENNVTAKLAISASQFKQAVASATEELNGLKKNVSLSLSGFSTTLRSTSSDLNDEVETAKDVIHEVDFIFYLFIIFIIIITINIAAIILLMIFFVSMINNVVSSPLFYLIGGANRQGQY